MKKLFLLTLLCVLSTAFFAQAKDRKPSKKVKGKIQEIVMEDTLPKVPVIFFKSLEHDYGTIYKKDNGDCTFEFKNTGKADLQLTNVSSSCGCTVPHWPKEPIAPGQTSIIKVTYNTNSIGSINKKVFVDHNAGERVTLSIKGNVVEPPSEITPENKPSSLLKNE